MDGFPHDIRLNSSLPSSNLAQPTTRPSRYAYAPTYPKEPPPPRRREPPPAFPSPHLRTRTPTDEGDGSGGHGGEARRRCRRSSSSPGERRREAVPVPPDLRLLRQRQGPEGELPGRRRRAWQGAGT